MPVPQLPAQTPITFLKAGDVGGFSAECVRLLNEAGYDPDDFGNHAHVQARLARARSDRAAYIERCRRTGERVRPDGPDPRTAFLARCQSGHLTQDAVMRGEGARGDACANYDPTRPGNPSSPPPPRDTRCYHTDMAPCMPMPTYGARGQRNRGSPHWAVGANERAQARDIGAGSPVTEPQMAANAEANAALVTQNPRTDHPVHDAHLSSANLSARERRDAETRRRGIQQAQARSADSLSGAGPPGSATGATGGAGQSAPAAGGSITGTTAAQCAENFRRAMMNRMRQQVVDEYGSNYEQTRANREQARDRAQAELSQAEARRPAADIEREMNDARNRGDHATARQRAGELGARRAQERRVAAAEQEVRNVDCLHRQARSLCSLSAPPPFEGFSRPPTAFPPMVGQAPGV